MSKKEIALIINEVRPLLTGGRVQKIFQASEREVTLVIRSSQTYSLFFSIDPEFFRVHLITKKRRNPQNPLSFCQFLRKHLTGLSVTSIHQAVDDRVISLAFRGRETEFHLVAELFGRSGNLFITDSGGKILNKLNKSRKEEREEISYSLQKSERGSENQPGDYEQDFPSEMVKENMLAEEIYQRKEETSVCEGLKKRIVTDLRKRAAKLDVRKERMKGDLASLKKCESYLKFGELIKDNFHLLSKGSSEVELLEYGTGEKRMVALNPSLTPLQNMNNYFSRYKKSIRGSKKITGLLKNIERDSLALAEKIEAVKDSTLEMLLKEHEIPQAAVAGKSVARTKNRTSKPYKFTSLEGLSILVGKSDTQNDEITFKIAKGNDLWFHVRDSGGAHVILRADKKAEPQQESIIDAASLALFYSKLKNETRGEVLYTRRKYIKKPKGDKPGRVIYTRDKTIFVHMESTRVRRLMESKIALGG